MFGARTPTLPPATHTNSYALGARDVLLIEPSTPYESEQLIEALKKNGKPFLAYSYPGEYHEFSKPEDRIDVWIHQRLFLRRFLPPARGTSSTGIQEIDLGAR